MKKQYVVAFINTNPRFNKTPFYLTNVILGYPRKTQEINEAKRFGTKAEARAELKGVSRDNLYHLAVEIIPA